MTATADTPQRPTNLTAKEREQARANRAAELAVRRDEFLAETFERREQVRHGHLRRQAAPKILFLSPSMAVFEVTVDDKGKLTTTQVVPAELTPR